MSRVRMVHFFFCPSLKFHSYVNVPRDTTHWTCCQFSFVCFVCLFSANLTITPDPISVSEGQNFSIKCISDVSNYDEVYWNTSAGIKIYQRFYTTRRYPDGAESVLTVKTSTREWNGEWKAGHRIVLPGLLETCNNSYHLCRVFFETCLCQPL